MNKALFLGGGGFGSPMKMFSEVRVNRDPFSMLILNALRQAVTGHHSLSFQSEVSARGCVSKSSDASICCSI